MKVAVRRRHYLREAALTLLLARLAVRLLPPARLFAWANRPLPRSRRFAGSEKDWVAWAVATIVARPWMRALCLPQALAAHAMLRRRGIASRLCLGVARDGSTLAAHAWVEIGGDKIAGETEPGGFTRIAEFGSRAS